MAEDATETTEAVDAKVDVPEGEAEAQTEVTADLLGSTEDAKEKTEESAAADEDDGTILGKQDIDYSGLEYPEGWTDEKGKESFLETAQGLGLTAEQAQGLIKFQAQRSEDLAKVNADSYAAQQDGWLKETRADTDFGGVRLPDTVKHIKAALKEYDSGKELEGLLRDSKLINHLPVVKFLARAGRKLSEGDIVAGVTTTPVENRRTADILFADPQ